MLFFFHLFLINIYIYVYIIIIVVIIDNIKIKLDYGIVFNFNWISNDFNVKVLDEFVKLHNFEGISYDNALRYLFIYPFIYT